jgi:hypothetical protein
VSPHTAAIEAGDSGELNRLILKAEKLEMGTEPLVAQAKEVRDKGPTSLCSDEIMCYLLLRRGVYYFFSSCFTRWVVDWAVWQRRVSSGCDVVTRCARELLITVVVPVACCCSQ